MDQIPLKTANGKLNPTPLLIPCKQKNHVDGDQNVSKDEEYLENGEIEELNPKEQKKSNTNFEYLMELAGTNGRWNWYFFFICSTTMIFWSMPALSYSFLGATPEHWCNIPELIQANWTYDQIIEYAIPLDENGKQSSCEMYKRNYDRAASIGFEAAMLSVHPNENETVACYSRQFNTTDLKYTTAIRWDLVCERRPIYATTQSATYIGIMTGAITAGYLADKFGRKKICTSFVVMYWITGFLGAFIPNITVYIIFRWLIAAAAHGYYVAAYIIAQEMCSVEKRPLVGSLFSCMWALGYSIVPCIAYFVRDYQWLQVTLTAPSLLMLAYFWIMPESPRWLVTKGRHEEALRVLQRAAKGNRRTLPSDQHMLKTMEAIMAKEELIHKSDPKSFVGKIRLFFKNIMDLFSSTHMRLLAGILFFCWMAVSMVYYGLSLNGANLSTDPYMYMLLGGLIEIPAQPIAWFGMTRLGRKWTFFLLFLLTGALLCLMLTIPPDVSWGVSMLALMGKMAIGPGWTVAYLYTVELFPTSKRSLTLGLASFNARFGTILSPYITDLLGENNPMLPSAVFGSVALAAAGLALFLPETNNHALPDVDSEAHHIYKNKAKSSQKKNGEKE